MNYLFFILLFTPVFTFNVSNMNEFSKNFITSNMKTFSKFVSLYTLDKSQSFEVLETTTNKPPDNNNIQNQIFFYSDVNEESSLALEQKLLNLNQHNLHIKEKYQVDNGPIHLHIRSFGGSLFHTLYLMDLIQKLETPIYTYVDGFAASAATLISVAGKKRFMTTNSMMLVHQLSGGTSGKYSEMKDENENIDLLMDIILNFYLKNTKMNKQTLIELLKRDIWLKSTKCLEYGLVDEII